MSKRLWEIDHPYYCSDVNYFKSESHPRFRSWAEFIAEFGDSDPDMNLVFRWDWQPPYKDGGSELPIIWKGDENYRDSTLQVFFMGQRKGYFWCREVEVCRADEPDVRAWLQTRWEHMRKLWEPLS